MKKLYFTIFCVTLCLQVFADSEIWSYHGSYFQFNDDLTCELVKCTNLSKKDSIINFFPSVIEYNGKNYTFTRIKSGAFSDSPTSVYVREIIVPDGVRTIELDAFKGCPYLKKIDLPNSLDSIFYCNLSESRNMHLIVIPEKTSYVGGFICHSNCDIAFLSKTILPEFLSNFHRLYVIPGSKIQQKYPEKSVEIISYGISEFTYNGSNPEPNIYSNIEGFECHAYNSNLTKHSGNYSTDIRTKLYNESYEMVFSLTYSYSIKKAGIAAKVNNVSRKYGEQNPNFTLSYEGIIDADKDVEVLTTPIYSTTANIKSDVGIYEVIASNVTFEDYEVTSYFPGELTINPAILTIKANNAERIYFADAPVYTSSYEGFVNDDDESVLLAPIEYTTDASKYSNTGDYTITPYGTSAKNYEINYQTGKLFVTKRNLVAKADNKERLYGRENPQFACSFEGFVNNEDEKCFITDPVVVTEANELSPVGNYSIVPSGAEAQNYDIQYKNGTLTITKASLHATVGDATKVYGEGNPNFTISYDGLIPTDAKIASLTPITYTTGATKQSGAGQYTVSASGASFKNYDVTEYVDGMLTITKAPLVIKANNASRLYFDDEPLYDFTCTGFVNGDNEACLSKIPSFTTNSDKYSDAGVYSITPYGAESDNYELDYAPGLLTVNKRSLKAKATDMIREYGDPNPAFKIQYEGFVNDETETCLSSIPTISCSATTQSAIGNYDIKVSGGSATNYAITCEKGILAINKAPLHVYVNDCSKIYAQSNPTFTCRYEGLKNNETTPAWESVPSYSTDATSASDVGEYEVKLINGVAKNYDMTCVDGTLTIDKAELKIKASNASRLYYEDNPTFTYTCYGFKNSDNESVFLKEPSFECPATMSSNAGEYPISIFGAESKNYSPIYESGSLTINKRLLTVLPNDASRKYGEENPDFNYDISGFVNNEDANVLLQTPKVYTNATSSTDVGIYPLYAKDAEATNYTFNYQQGRLTINKADQFITWNQEFDGIRVGDQIELQATASSGLDIEYMFDTDIVSIYKANNSSYLDCLGVGTFAIRAIQNGNKNYNAAVRVAKTITIEDVDGISPILSESNGNPIYFDLSGKRVETPQKGKCYISVTNGKAQKIYIK